VNTISQQVRRARKRLIIGRLCRSVCIALCVSWTLAAAAMLVRALWPVPIPATLWDSAWLVGSTVLGLVGALVWTFWSAPPLQAAAEEVDARFGLQQRLSSVWGLPEALRESPVGRALVEDAEKCASPIDMRERFGVAPGRIAWLPLVPAALMGLAAFLPAASGAASVGSGFSATQKQALVSATATLKKKIEQKRQQAEATGLKDQDEFFKRLEAEFDRLAERQSLDPKDALVAMNDIKDQLEQRRKQLGSGEQLRQSLAKIPPIEKGPLQGLSDAIKESDFAEAQRELRSLAEKLRDDKLSAEERKELADQVEKFSQRVEEQGQKIAQELAGLEQQLAQARSEGRTADEAKLNQQIAELRSAQAQQSPLEKLSQSMGVAKSKLDQGKAGEASDELNELADQMAQMDADSQQLEELEVALDLLDQTKQQMRCDECQGKGCEKCKSSASSPSSKGSEGSRGSKRGGKPGNAIAGRGVRTPGGQGYGTGSDLKDGAAEELPEGAFDSRVKTQPKAGPGMIVGPADGPNRQGVSREAIKTAVMAAAETEDDPLENQPLPRIEREHTREYFDRLRQGKSGP
jgi:hypothetical protein